MDLFVGVKEIAEDDDKSWLCLVDNVEDFVDEFFAVGGVADLEMGVADG